ncbi:Holliday junction branch migration protein RuvA [bacterium]|nr:Holliday junction branch migration protein RuvA [candidate division CSSED10-310 bacterium]
MIGFIRGHLLRSTPDRIIVDCGGVGYELLIPLSTYRALPAVGGLVELEVTSIWSQEALLLVGFESETEKEMFAMLGSISRIGTKLALAILGHIAPGEFVRAVQDNDVERLSRIPGIGRKTAERLLVECRDKVARLTGIVVAPTEIPLLPESPVQHAACSALINLGYKEAEARAAIRDAMAAAPKTDDERELIRAALRNASRRSG